MEGKEKEDSYCGAATIVSKRVVSIPFIRQEGFSKARFFQKGRKGSLLKMRGQTMNERKQWKSADVKQDVEPPTLMNAGKELTYDIMHSHLGGIESDECFDKSILMKEQLKRGRLAEVKR